MTVAVIIKATRECVNTATLVMITVAVIPKEGIETNDCCCYHEGCRLMCIYVLL